MQQLRVLSAASASRVLKSQRGPLRTHLTCGSSPAQRVCLFPEHARSIFGLPFALARQPAVTADTSRGSGRTGTAYVRVAAQYLAVCQLTSGICRCPCQLQFQVQHGGRHNLLEVLAPFLRGTAFSLSFYLSLFLSLSLCLYVFPPLSNLPTSGESEN